MNRFTWRYAKSDVGKFYGEVFNAIVLRANSCTKSVSLNIFILCRQNVTVAVICFFVNRRIFIIIIIIKKKGEGEAVKAGEVEGKWEVRKEEKGGKEEVRK